MLSRQQGTPYARGRPSDDFPNFGTTTIKTFGGNIYLYVVTGFMHYIKQLCSDSYNIAFYVQNIIKQAALAPGCNSRC